MTDETTNPNRWTAEVGGAGRTRYVDVFDGGECLDNVECYSRKQAESLAEQINRPAPTAPADDLRRVQAMQVEARESQAVAERHRAAHAKTERCLIAAETLDRDHLDDLERNNADPQSRRLKEVIDRRRAELDVLRPADELPPGVERISDGTYICRGIDIPEGWEFYSVHESTVTPADDSLPAWDWRDREVDTRTAHVYYQVRLATPAEPATEWVPLHELSGRKLPGCEWCVDGIWRIHGQWRVSSKVDDNSDVIWQAINLRADGMVEVQR